MEIILIIIMIVTGYYLGQNFFRFNSRVSIQNAHMQKHSSDCKRCVRIAAINHVQGFVMAEKNHGQCQGMQKLYLSE